AEARPRPFPPRPPLRRGARNPPTGWMERCGTPWGVHSIAPTYNGRMAQEKRYEISVTPAVQYLPDQSDEKSGRYVFAYTITIRNTGNATAQLISRHWINTDSQGLVQEVRGLGEVDEQAVLGPAGIM